MQLSIREAVLEDAADAAAIVEVLNSYAADPVGGGSPLGSRVRARLVPALRAQANALVLLAFADRKAAGLAICFFGLSTFQARPLLNIHDLAVVPERRGQGIGRALLGAVEARARSRGCCKLTLEVQEGNARARALYERFGFTDFVLGEPVATRFLSKPLSGDDPGKPADGSVGRPPRDGDERSRTSQ
jgi:ribosomal protein S18 acetylase RimI-like enzyme